MIKYTIIKYCIIYFCSLIHACRAMILSEERDNIINIIIILNLKSNQSDSINFLIVNNNY